MVDLRSVRPVSLLLVALTAFSVEAAGAQLVSPLKNPRLSLGISSGTGEDETEMPLTLAGPAVPGVGKIEALVTLPAALNFEKVTGIRVEQKVVKVDAKVQEKDGQRVLALTVQSGNPDKPLPNEALATLVFKVVKGAQPGVLSLDLQAKAFAPDNKEITPVDVYGGRVNIQESEAFYTCFFYMH